MDDLKKAIRDIPDFPKEGIIFKDITTLLNNKNHLKKAIDTIVEKYKDADIDYVAGIESRGFIFGTAIAYLLDAGFVPVRKPGKLPSKTIDISYELEYGTDSLSIHEDAFNGKENANVLLVDDLLATGGTAAASIELIKKAGGNLIAAAFVIELGFLNGREKLDQNKLFSIIKY